MARDGGVLGKTHVPHRIRVYIEEIILTLEEPVKFKGHLPIHAPNPSSP